MSTFPSTSPRDGTIKAQIESDDSASVRAAVRRSRTAQVQWAKKTVAERGRVLERIRKRFLREAEGLVEVLTEENGRPEGESWLSEVVPNGDLFTYWIKNAGQYLKRERVPLNPINFPKKTAFIEYVPRGVIGLISPWNLPVAIPVRALVPALMAGNGVVFKPSEFAARTGQKLAEIFQAELPDGLLEVVQGDGVVGAAVIEHHVDMVLFTGSEQTGRKVAVAAGLKLIPVSLELGGKDAAIVCADANLERAAQGIVWAAMFNAGQNCAGIERVYVEKSVAARFIQNVCEVAGRLRLGEDVGPLCTPAQLAIVEKHVEAAKAAGAKVEVGGERGEGDGYWFKPTVLTQVGDDLEIMVDETFGPVLPIRIVEDVDEAVKLTNRSRYGLTASVWTKNVWKGWEIGKRLDVGVLTVNNHAFTGGIPSLPWGGVKASGFGTTNSHLALEHMVQARTVLLDRSNATQELWWYPYNETLVAIASALRDLGLGKLSALGRLLSNLPKRFK